MGPPPSAGEGLVTDFVLVPGAWLGAWAWRDVVPPLQRAGHAAYPVTLTGMGERVHLLTPEVGMETAIQDVLNVIQFNELREFVLVGHSFAGKVAAAVADRRHAHVKTVVYLDAFRPEIGHEPQGGFDPSREFGAPPAGQLGVPLTEEIVERIGKDVQGEHRRRMLALGTPWPIRLAKDPITLSSHYDPAKERYVFCTLSGDPVEEIVAGKWGELHGPHQILEAGHWPMITRPEQLAKALVALAR